MRMPLFLHAYSVRALLVLSILIGIATNLHAAGSEAGNPATPRQVRPTTIRWSAEQQNVINGMRKLSTGAPFRQPAQQFEREVLRTEPALRRAQSLLQKPVEDRSAYDDVIRQLQQHRSKLIQLQNKLVKAADQIPAPRSDRQLASSQFENANQKGTQYINMLTNVLKTIHEMQMGVIRNLR